MLCLCGTGRTSLCAHSKASYVAVLLPLLFSHCAAPTDTWRRPGGCLSYNSLKNDVCVHATGKFLLYRQISWDTDTRMQVFVCTHTKKYDSLSHYFYTAARFPEPESTADYCGHKNQGLSCPCRSKKKTNEKRKM